MALFGEKKDGGADKRQFERKVGKGERVMILRNGASSEDVFDLRDISIGGFAVAAYKGGLKANQYFDFALMVPGEADGTKHQGVAHVVRVTEEFLAAKLPPQPKLRRFLRDYLG